jgi:Transposase
VLSKNHGKRSTPRDWKKYDEFRRLDEMLVLNIISKAVNALDPPYKVKEKGSVGRPDADPRAIAKLLIFRAFFGTSYRSTFSKLHDNVEYRKALGVEHLPAPSTMQAHNKDISEAYFQRVIGLIALMIMNLQGRSSVNAAADSTGLSTNMYGRWYTVKYGEGDRRQYIKLHAIVTADTDMPFFIYAKVTDGTASDAAELEEMISNVDVNVGEMYLDKGYLSRANAQLIADIGAVPYIAIKSNVKSKSYGYPAWNRMVNMYRENPDDYAKHYNRRSVIEGVFSAMKRRMQSSIRSRIFHNQVLEAICRAAVWNAISLAYHMI